MLPWSALRPPAFTPQIVPGCARARLKQVAGEHPACADGLLCSACNADDMAMVAAGRALTTYSFLQTPVPPIFQNVNSVYGYVRMRVNATTLITEVGPFPVSMLACA